MWYRNADNRLHFQYRSGTWKSGRKRKFNSACGKTGGFDPASNGTIPKGDESESLQRNGTVKKGHKQWNFSKRYQKLKQRHQELCRIAAENRVLAIREQVNHLRSLGDCFITEPPNAKKLQKEQIQRIRSIRMDEWSEKALRKIHKKSLPRLPAGKSKATFESTGGMYVEVPILYRASQYDHTSDSYIPKKLSQRMYHLADGTKVQRDWYSSYLLYCINKTYTQINKLKCRSNFATMYQKEKNMIEEIIRSGKRLWIPVFVPFNFIAPGIWLSIHLGDLVAQRTRMWRFSSIESTQMWS